MVRYFTRGPGGVRRYLRKATAAQKRRYRARKLLSTTRLGKLVRRIANRGIEVKHVGANVVNAAFNSQIGSASECYPILPPVTEGTDGHQRIGDKINAKYLIVKGHLQYDAGFQGNFAPPSTVRILLLSQRNIKISSDVSSRADVEHLLKDNIGTDLARAYTGTMFDNLAPINKDLFTVHMDRKIKMLPQLYTGLGNTQDTNTKTLSGTQRTYMFVKKIRVPKTLHFDDGNGSTPNNFAPFVCMGGVCDDNAGAFSLSTPYRLTVQSVLYFTDA